MQALLCRDLCLRAFLLAMTVSFGMSAMAQSPLASDDPDLLNLLNARAIAEAYIAQGQHNNAATVLVQSLRNCPATRPELSDAAYGNGQMASYLFLHIMQEADAYNYLLTQIAPQTYVTDKMLKLLCFIAIGLESEQKTELSQEITYLTSSDNLIVRNITRFYLSNPYFYDNNSFTNQFAQQLVTDYPALELTQISLNLSLYAKNKTVGLEGIAADMGLEKGKKIPYQPWSQQLRTRIQSSGDVLARKDGTSRRAAMAPMLEGITKAPDWRERHFCLLLMKGELDGELKEDLRAAARALAQRPENTPDILEARVLLAKSLSAEGNDESAHAEAFELAQTLLEAGVDVPTPERVMWETRVYGIQSCADNLAKAERVIEAVTLYDALIETLPGSKIADASRDALKEIFVNKPLLRENARR